MDNIKKQYEKRIEILEKLLKQKIAELRKERECNEEAMRYIYALVEKLGGRAEIRLSELSNQKGVIKCREIRGREVLTIWIDSKGYSCKLKPRRKNNV